MPLRAHLRPWPGRLLPPELEPPGAARAGAALPLGLADPGFEELVHRIDTGPVHAGNAVALYTDGPDAFGAAGEAIARARSEVLVETYILRDDSTGRALRAQLAAAAARGVAVRMLADGWGSFTVRSRFWRGLASAGIAVRVFHPMWKQWRYHLYRDHRKIIVVDRQVAFTGGMNIADEYGSPEGPPGTVWRDTHCRVEGPAAWELAVVFREGWVRAGGDPFPIEPLSAAPAAPGARVLVLDSQTHRGNVETASVLAATIGAARRRVWITNAYFAPGSASVRGLGAVARRGVDVRLLLPGRSDVPLLRHAGHGYYADLLAAGVRVFEYRAAVLHAKTIVADDRVGVVGSSNLDVRSFRYNAECNLLIMDPGVADELAAAFERDLAFAEEVTPAAWSRRGVLHRTGDALARSLTPLL